MVGNVEKTYDTGWIVMSVNLWKEAEYIALPSSGCLELRT